MVLCVICPVCFWLVVIFYSRVKKKWEDKKCVNATCLKTDGPITCVSRWLVCLFLKGGARILRPLWNDDCVNHYFQALIMCCCPLFLKLIIDNVDHCCFVFLFIRTDKFDCCSDLVSPPDSYREYRQHDCFYALHISQHFHCCSHFRSAIGLYLTWCNTGVGGSDYRVKSVHLYNIE